MRDFGVSWLVVLVLVGCGSVKSSSDAGTSSDSGTEIDAAAPPDASPDEADAAIVAVTCQAPPVCGAWCQLWGAADVDSVRNRTPSFLVANDFSVCPDDVPLPPDCSSGETLCNAQVLITVDPNLNGVAETAACNGALFSAGSRFRVRFNLEPPSQVNQFLTAHLHIERPCGAECEDGEHRCEANDNCYQDRDVCFACARGTLEECACRNADNGVLSDCTECEFSYGDVVELGECLSGECVSDEKVYCFTCCDTCPCQLPG
jgi:hypothetical protein